MRLLPWDYGVRNLLRRPLRTSLTALGLTLVVFLLLLVVGFLQGLKTSLEQSGDEQVVLIHSLATAENLENSSVGDRVNGLVRTGLASYIHKYDDVLAVSPELLIATTIGAQTSDGQAQLGSFRGVNFESVFLVRNKVSLIEGKLPATGKNEVLVGRLAAAKLGLKSGELAVGQTLEVEGKKWTVSGRFAAPGTLLEAELWCPLQDLKLHMRRPNDISLVALRLRPDGDPEQHLSYIKRYCRDQNLYLDPSPEIMASRETDYYASLQEHGKHLQALAWVLVVLVAAAGACGAINTMYAAVMGRVREFAALQALGYPRRAIALSLIQESVLLSAFATLLATGLALVLIQGVAIRFTMGAFALQLDQTALLVGCGAGLGLGVIGALPPAIRAFRMPVADGLKAV